MPSGYFKLTASGAVGPSGKPIRLYGYTQLTNATGIGLVTLYDGTSASGTETAKNSGVANGTSQVSFGGAGKYFPTGLFANLDADVNYVTFDVEVVNSI